jgi:hypothetical protein
MDSFGRATSAGQQRNEDFMDRSHLGAEKIGEPVIEAYRTLHALGEQKSWPDFNWEPVNYYYNRMIGSWLLELIDNSLSDVQLEAVKREQVTLIVLLLFRDLFRHHSNLLRPAAANASWVEPFFQEVASDLRLADEAIEDNGLPYEIDNGDLQNCTWAKLLAAPFGLPAEKLLVCHSAIVTGVTEEFGRHRHASKRWWQFWK